MLHWSTLAQNTILVGHTPVQKVAPLYDGRVIAIQVYPRRDKVIRTSVAEGLRLHNVIRQIALHLFMGIELWLANFLSLDDERYDG